jgi:hypothetical protein
MIRGKLRNVDLYRATLRHNATPHAVPASFASRCVTGALYRMRSGLVPQHRGYAQYPPGSGKGGMPGFNMFGQQLEKGDALKQYVSMQQ